MGKYKCIVFWMFLNGAAFFNYFAAAQCFHEKTLVKWVLNGLEMIREKLNRGEEDEDPKYVRPIPLPAMGFFFVSYKSLKNEVIYRNVCS